VIESTGGKVLVKAKVDKILIKNNKAYGVLTQKGQEIKAKLIISNAGVFNTFGPLMDQKISSSLKLPMDKIKPGMTHFYVFVGFDQSAEDLKLPASNYWIHQSYDYKNIPKYREGTDPDNIQWEHCGYFISFPSSKDPTFSKRFPNKSTCVVVAEANYDWVKEWADKRIKQRGGDYLQFKNEVKENLIKALVKQFPHLEEHIKFTDVATPITNEFYLNSYRGSSYGLKFSSNNDFFKPETPIENLFLSGQDITSMGFSGAVGGALMCYAAITGEDIGEELKKKLTK
jgi:all-trans-retinol 13,14-reductase